MLYTINAKIIKHLLLSCITFLGGKASKALRLLIFDITKTTLNQGNLVTPPCTRDSFARQRIHFTGWSKNTGFPFLVLIQAYDKIIAPSIDLTWSNCVMYNSITHYNPAAYPKQSRWSEKTSPSHHPVLHCAPYLHVISPTMCLVQSHEGAPKWQGALGFSQFSINIPGT